MCADPLIIGVRMLHATARNRARADAVRRVRFV
jgi:hypothetical protein